MQRCSGPAAIYAVCLALLAYIRQISTFFAIRIFTRKGFGSSDPKLCQKMAQHDQDVVQLSLDFGNLRVSVVAQPLPKATAKRTAKAKPPPRPVCPQCGIAKVPRGKTRRCYTVLSPAPTAGIHLAYWGDVEAGLEGACLGCSGARLAGFDTDAEALDYWYSAEVEAPVYYCAVPRSGFGLDDA